MTGNREAHLFPLVGFHQREAKNVRSVWAEDRSGLGFPLHGTAETQLIDALIESMGYCNENGGPMGTAAASMYLPWLS